MMKKLELISLKLTNFQRIKSFEFNPAGESVSVFGDNAKGKTTLFNGFMWLMFGKDSLNQVDFDIKRLSEKGEPEHGMSHEVEGVLSLNGASFTLKKSYSEKWTKKRGQVKQEMTGHTTDHFLDGVPVSKKEYDARISEICEESVFRLLTNPRHFNEVLHWSKRRAALLDICGDITDADVIASNMKLKKLPDVIGTRSIDDHRKIIASRRSEINKELEKIPVRIDEAAKSMPDIPALNVQKIISGLDHLKKEHAEKSAELYRMENGGELAEKTKRLRLIEAEAQNTLNQFEAEKSKRLQAEFVKINGINSQTDMLARSLSNYKADIKNLESVVNVNDSMLATLRKDWTDVDETTFTVLPVSTCPTCGQDIPADQIAAAKAKAEADFNNEKAERLKGISQKGVALKAANETAKEKIHAAQVAIEKITGGMETLNAEKKTIEANINAIESEKYLGLLPGKEDLEKEIESLKSGDDEKLKATIRNAMNIFQEQIDELQGQLLTIKQAETTKARIEELMAQEKNLAAEFEELEAQLYLTEQFIRSKVALLEEKINRRFENVRFKLFHEQVNGGIEEVCETLWNGVPYCSMNNAARINSGLDIINTLSDHYGFMAPIFVDNAEAVTELQQTKSQMVRLVVSEKHKQLTVETKSKPAAKKAA